MKGGNRQKRRKKKERERDSGRAFGTSGLCFSSGTVCCYVALGTFKRGLGRVNNDGKIGGKMDLCKVPGVKFIWNKNFLSVFFFYFQLQSLFPFVLWCVCKWPFVC